MKYGPIIGKMLDWPIIWKGEGERNAIEKISYIEWNRHQGIFQKERCVRKDFT